MEIKDHIEIPHLSPGKQDWIPTQMENEPLKKLQTFFHNQGSRLCIGDHSQTHDIWNRPRPLNKTEPDLTQNHLVNEASNNPGAFSRGQKRFFIIGAKDCIEIPHLGPGKQDLIPTQMKNEPLKKLQTFVHDQGSRLCIGDHSQTHDIWNRPRPLNKTTRLDSKSPDK